MRAIHPLVPRAWVLCPTDEQQVTHLQQCLNVHPAICQILVQRGVTTFEEARAFFRPSLDMLHDPFLMRDMDKAIARITTAIAHGERILIYGDYDVDGTTSVATVYSFFKGIYPQLDYYIPNRYTEGYGISTQGIDYAQAEGISLIIALDCGIKSVDKVQYALERGIDFIICDHHLPGDELPAAVAVLDPKRSDCPYPYKELSGCGIGFKLIEAFAIQHSIDRDKVHCYLDLVCLSIASDIVPITGENRILAYHGLIQVNQYPSPGIKRLKEAAGIRREMDISDVVFVLGPRINAAGRIDDARTAVRLLIAAADSEEVDLHADSLQQLNKERKDLDRAITEQALDLLATDETNAVRNSTVLYHELWHKGVIGIVASRLIDYYYRPTVMLTLSNGVVTGSARSVRGFDLYEAIYACREHLIQFGGHAFAAGMTMRPDQVAGFKAAFESIVTARITPDQKIPKIDIHAELSPADIKPALHRVITQMGPFGPSNMKPVFWLRGLRDTGWAKILQDTHLKFAIRLPDDTVIQAIGFGLAHHYALVRDKPFDCCCQIDTNEWNGTISLQLMVKDIKPCE
jgi:single-stranded-DNA-specific exonuclease